MLFSEYRFFKRQSDRLLELQSDYRTYIMAVNKVLHDYNKTKEKLDILKSAENCGPAKEKKKEIDVVGLGFYAYEFPKDVHIFSSDDFSYDDTRDSLLLINRDPDYLRDCADTYFKKTGRRSLFSLVHIDNWCDYTQYALSKGAPRKPITKRIAKKKRNRKVASYRGPRTAVGKNKNRDIALSWPLNRSNFWMSSLFGPRKKPNGSWGFHYGLDMAAMRGTPVCAASSGIVTEARYSRGYGNTVIITHNRKYRTRYAHLDKILVKVGQKVKSNQLIGKVGRTGLVWKSRGRDPSHLHFEVHAFGKQVNPLKFLA